MINGVQYCVVQTTLGQVVVAATQQGVCRVAIGDDVEDLTFELLSHYPEAQLVEFSETLYTWAQAIVALIEAPTEQNPPPLDLKGTEFQQQVWRILLGIPPGNTETYGGIAQRLGMPGGERAVAGACARNPVAVAVPCHRVLRQDGGLGGYRWEVWRKQALLEREGAYLC